MICLIYCDLLHVKKIKNVKLYINIKFSSILLEIVCIHKMVRKFKGKRLEEAHDWNIPRIRFAFWVVDVQFSQQCRIYKLDFFTQF